FEWSEHDVRPNTLHVGLTIQSLQRNPVLWSRRRLPAKCSHRKPKHKSQHQQLDSINHRNLHLWCEVMRDVTAIMVTEELIPPSPQFPYTANSERSHLSRGGSMQRRTYTVLTLAALLQLLFVVV